MAGESGNVPRITKILTDYGVKDNSAVLCIANYILQTSALWCGKHGTRIVFSQKIKMEFASNPPPITMASLSGL